ncbi:MAG: hypothetical protein M1827_001901 [Pycnora praestabilis]|nr:MAG: hypothetical protein M1827_001901 [Pycnora praestabilis]
MLSTPKAYIDPALLDPALLDPAYQLWLVHTMSPQVTLTTHEHIEAPKTETSSTPFPFLELPTEIRNMIYRYLVAPKDTIHLAKFRGGVKGLATAEGNASILRANRQIHLEAAGVFFHYNKLCLEVGERTNMPIQYRNRKSHNHGMLQPHVFGRFRVIQLKLTWPTFPAQRDPNSYKHFNKKTTLICAALASSTNVKELYILLSDRLEDLDSRPVFGTRFHPRIGGPKGDYAVEMKERTLRPFLALQNIPKIVYVAC